MPVEPDTRKDVGFKVLLEWNRDTANTPLVIPRYPSQPAGGSPVVTGDRARPVVGQSMGLVPLTVGCVALGTYMRRDLTGGAGLALSVGAVIAPSVSTPPPADASKLAITLLFGHGPLLSLAVGPILNAYSAVT